MNFEKPEIPHILLSHKEYQFYQSMLNAVNKSKESNDLVRRQSSSLSGKEENEENNQEAEIQSTEKEMHKKEEAKIHEISKEDEEEEERKEEMVTSEKCYPSEKQFDQNDGSSNLKITPLEETLSTIKKKIPKCYLSNFKLFEHEVLRSKKFYKRLSAFDSANLEHLLLKQFSRKTTKRLKNESAFNKIFVKSDIKYTFANTKMNTDTAWWKLH